MEQWLTGGVLRNVWDQRNRAILHDRGFSGVAPRGQSTITDGGRPNASSILIPPLFSGADDLVIRIVPNRPSCGLAVLHFGESGDDTFRSLIGEFTYSLGYSKQRSCSWCFPKR